MEGFKKDYMDERVPLKRRIPGTVMYTAGTLQDSHDDCKVSMKNLIKRYFFYLAFFNEDPRERLKEDDLDVVLSPQRRSFGSGCQGNALPAAHVRRPTSPLENKENETLRLGGPRRIGSGRIIPARVFEREARVEKDRERERDFKDKRFRVGFL